MKNYDLLMTMICTGQERRDAARWVFPFLGMNFLWMI